MLTVTVPSWTISQNLVLDLEERCYSQCIDVFETYIGAYLSLRYSSFLIKVM